MTRRPLTLAMIAALMLALAAPALADTVPLTVSLTVGGGTRQFQVKQANGQDFPGTGATLDLSNGSAQFRALVIDNNFGTLTQPFTVAATLTNLYRNTASGVDYGTVIPSSSVTINSTSTPLASSDITLSVKPTYLLGGTLNTCSSLASTVDLSAATTLCATLSALSTTSISTTTAPVVQSVTTTISDLTKLPFGLGGADNGVFTRPDYTAAIGAGDPNKPSPLVDGTNRAIMHGTPASATALADLASAALTAAGLGVVSATGSNADMSLDAMLDAIAAQSATLATAVSQIRALNDPTKELAIVSSVTATLASSEVVGITGTYTAQPTVTTPGDAPVSGTYTGTLTVTFVQS